MKPKSELTLSELYALERAARSARAQEIRRLIRSGVDALVRFAGRAVSVLENRKGMSHA
jgi:hypothetical protein